MAFGNQITITYPDASTVVLDRTSYPTQKDKTSSFRKYDGATGIEYELFIRHSIQKDGAYRHNVEYVVTIPGATSEDPDVVNRQYAVLIRTEDDVDTDHAESLAAWLDSATVLGDLYAEQA